MSVESHGKKPLNTAYFGIYYFGIVVALSTVLVSSSQESIHYIYIFLQTYGFEDALLCLRRYASMSHYLMEIGNIERWEEIVCYSSYAIPIFFLFLIASFIFDKPYFYWWIKTHQTKKPEPTAKLYRHLQYGFLFLVVVFLYTLYAKFIAISTWENPHFSTDKIHRSDFGYFYLALEYTVILLQFQFCHAVYSVLSTARSRLSKGALEGEQ